VRPKPTDIVKMTKYNMCELELMELYISIRISIELNFAGLIEQMKPVNTKIDPIEKLYDLRTRV